MPTSIAFSMPLGNREDSWRVIPTKAKKSSRAKGARGPQVSRAEQNSVKPESTSADRSRKVRTEAAAQDENTIRARRARIRSQSTVESEPKPSTMRRGAPDTDSRAVPEHINTRYIKVGNKYHFTNGDLAFADRGRGLSTRLENTEVIRDLIAIAKERGWNDIAIRGHRAIPKRGVATGEPRGLYRPRLPAERPRTRAARPSHRSRAR